jgi:beta-galactosidase
MILKNRQLAFSIFILALFLFNYSCTTNSTKGLVQGAIWRDTDGNIINAHGGCVLFYNETYYWYGECKGDSTYRLDWVKSWDCWRADARGISCYSSKDLVKWKFEGIVLPAVQEDTTSDLHPSEVIERPKVIYNKKTGKFVMWMHIESPDYEKACAGVAIGDRPDSLFTYLGSFKPNGSDSRDQTIYKDDDNRAYQITSSEWNRTIYINLLNDDYTGTTGKHTRNFVDRQREAPAVFKHNKKYYMITSGCTGWDPNTARFAMADSMLGEWTLCGNPCKGENSGKTFFAQSTFVLPLDEKNEQFVAIFDKWKKTDLADSRYIWLPVTFKNDSIVIQWQENWTPPRSKN